MNKPFHLTSVFTALLLSITCAACGRAAVTPQLRQYGELRTAVRDMTDPGSRQVQDGSQFEDPAGARVLRQSAQDSSLSEARAARSGWAAADAR
jgi:hypothetical protein